MLPDDFVFKVDVTDRLYHAIRRTDMKFEIRRYNCPQGSSAIYEETEIACFIGNGWTILSTNEDETEIDIQNLL